VTKYDQVIPSGSEGKVIASINLAHIKGRVEKGVDIETNDPIQPRAKLLIQAVIKTYVDIQPNEQVNFSVAKGEKQTQELTLVPTYDKPFTLTGATVNSDAFEVQLEPASDTPAGEKPKQYKLKVNIKESAKIGRERGTIKVTAEGLPDNTIEIPVFATVRGPISVNPPMVSFQIRSFPQEVSPRKTANIRQQPQATSPIATKVSTPATLRVIAAKEDWYQVITADNKLGWVTKAIVKTTKAAQDPTSMKVTLVKSTEGNFKVLNFSSTLPEVKVELDKTAANAGNKYDFKVSLLNKSQIKSKVGPGKIVVTTDDAEQPEVTIPVYISVS
jgi:uncharacterized protein YgiM (DUF1202 family)